jgi:hypothetical protein
VTPPHSNDASSIGWWIYHSWTIAMADGRISRFNLDAIELALTF